MKTISNTVVQKKTDALRHELLSALPVKEHQLKAGGISTAYIEGGRGTPLVLLHGPGEPGVWWMRVIPGLVEKFRVIVPDLPGHGSSDSPEEKFSRQALLAWLDEFLNKTCSTPPILVGHVVGGAIAARYAIHHGKKVKQIILVDSLGLAAFRPALRFAFEFLRFMINPSNKSQNRFLTQCMYDVNKLHYNMGSYWQPFLDYSLLTFKIPEKKSAAKGIMNAMIEKIPGEELKKLKVPVTLIWGRHDKANKLKIAVDASKKYNWPLHVIEDARDDPKLEKPDVFVQIIETSVAESQEKRNNIKTVSY